MLSEIMTRCTRKMRISSEEMGDSYSAVAWNFRMPLVLQSDRLSSSFVIYGTDDLPSASVTLLVQVAGVSVAVMMIIVVGSVEVATAMATVAVISSGVIVVVLLETPSTTTFVVVEVIVMLLDKIFSGRLRIRVVLVPVLLHFLHL